MLSDSAMRANQLSGSRADGISYRQVPELPGTTFFDCTRLLAGLTTSACADMWRSTNEGHSERYTACRSCLIGAAHAGVSNASRSPIRGALVCARCGRSATRLIHKHICVSCANREYELIKGRNARGMVPTRLAPLAPRQVFYRAVGRTHAIRRERTTHAGELVIAALRDSVHSVEFARAWRFWPHQVDVSLGDPPSVAKGRWLTVGTAAVGDLVRPLPAEISP